MSNPFLKHHADQLVNMASTHALASEFIEDMPKSVAICNIAMGIASTTMTEEQMQALNNELEPVLERITEELKAVANKHGISFSGHGAALIGKTSFPTPRRPGRIRARSHAGFGPERADGIYRRGVGLI